MKFISSIGVNFLFCFLLGVLNGCLENPGPDKHLGIEKRHVFSDLGLAYNQKIRFSLTQDLGKVTLKMANIESNIYNQEIIGKNDFFTFVIQLIKKDSNNVNYGFVENPVFEYRGHVDFSHFAKLSFGETIDMGEIGSLTDYEINDLQLVIKFMKVTYKNSVISSKWIGIYKGNYQGTNDTIFGGNGTFKAYITPDGRIDFYMHPTTSLKIISPWIQYLEDSTAWIPFSENSSDIYAYMKIYRLDYNTVCRFIDANHAQWRMLIPVNIFRADAGEDTVTFNLESIPFP